MGLADLVRELRVPAPSANAVPMPLATLPANMPIRSRSITGPAPRKAMKLDVFCAQYELSDDIKTKLDAIHIPGPHVLSLIADADLRGEGKLSIGQLASVRDAELRWKYSAVE